MKQLHIKFLGLLVFVVLASFINIDLALNFQNKNFITLSQIAKNAQADHEGSSCWSTGVFCTEEYFVCQVGGGSCEDECTYYWANSCVATLNPFSTCIEDPCEPF